MLDCCISFERVCPDSFFQAVASPFHSFVATQQLVGTCQPSVTRCTAAQLLEAGCSGLYSTNLRRCGWHMHPVCIMQTVHPCTDTHAFTACRTVSASPLCWSTMSTPFSVCRHRWHHCDEWYMHMQPSFCARGPPHMHYYQRIEAHPSTASTRGLCGGGASGTLPYFTGRIKSRGRRQRPQLVVVKERMTWCTLAPLGACCMAAMT